MPFVKGDPRINRKGRPIDLLQQSVRDILSEQCPDDEKKSNLRAILERQTAKAIKGDLRAAIWLADRAWGTPKQTIETPDIQDVRTFVLNAAGEMSELRKGENGRFLPESEAGAGVQDTGQPGDANPV